MLVTFVVAAFVLSVLPGPDLMLVLRTSLRSRRAGVLCGVGAACGAMGWGVAAAFGLAALLHASARVYEAVRLAGAAYLIWIGLRTLRRTRAEPAAGAAPGGRRVPALATGLVSDLLNPKTGAFYMAVVPQLIPAGAPVFTGTLLFAAVDAVVAAAWFAIVVQLARSVGAWLRRPGTVRRAEVGIGLLLIGVGLRTALQGG